jgi:hypothetical protein
MNLYSIKRHTLYIYMYMYSFDGHTMAYRDGQEETLGTP